MIDEPRLTFGVIQYSNGDLRNDPDRAVRAIEMLGNMNDAGVRSFQGMFASTDRWSRRARVSSRSLAQLRVDVGAGVYSHVVAYVGERNRESATLTVDCIPISDHAHFPLNSRLVGEAKALGGWRSAERMSLSVGHLRAWVRLQRIWRNRTGSSI